MDSGRLHFVLGYAYEGPELTDRQIAERLPSASPQDRTAWANGAHDRRVGDSWRSDRIAPVGA